MFSVHELQVSADILRGASQIAAFLFGSSNHKRKVYYLAERDFLPVFRVGAILCARKSTLIEWIVAMENVEQIVERGRSNQSSVSGSEVV